MRRKLPEFGQAFDLRTDQSRMEIAIGHLRMRR
jgi:hypothetical protein